MCFDSFPWTLALAFSQQTRYLKYTEQPSWGRCVCYRSGSLQSLLSRFIDEKRLSSARTEKKGEEAPEPEPETPSAWHTFWKVELMIMIGTQTNDVKKSIYVDWTCLLTYEMASPTHGLLGSKRIHYSLWRGWCWGNVEKEKEAYLYSRLNLISLEILSCRQVEYLLRRHPL